MTWLWWLIAGAGIAALVIAIAWAALHGADEPFDAGELDGFDDPYDWPGHRRG